MLFSFSACEDPTTIGSELLEDEAFDLDAETSFDITASTISGERLSTYINGITNFFSFPVGNYTDPVFGNVSSAAHVRLQYDPTLGIPNLSKGNIDSVVMVLSYDTLSTYGVLQDIHNVSIYEITSFPTTDTIFADASVQYNSEPLGNKMVPYLPKDSVKIVNYEADTATQTLKPQIRIPLDKARFTTIFSDFESVNSITEFQAKFSGMLIKSESTIGSLLGLNLGTTANDGASGINGVYIYYRDSSNVKDVIKMTFGERKFLAFDNGFAEGPYGHVLNKESEGQTLLFLQGLDGGDIKLKFNDLAKLQGKIINHAELEITAAVLDGDMTKNFPFVPQLNMGYKTNGNFITITDIADLYTALIDINLGFGGNLVARTGTPNGTYKMNITKALKGMIEGTIPGNELIITVLSKAQRPHRSVLYGPKHPQYPIKLKVTFTNR